MPFARMLAAVTTIAALALLTAPVAGAVSSGTETAASGNVSATLTYTATKDLDPIVTNLTVTRDGVTAFDGPPPNGVCDKDSPYCGPPGAISGSKDGSLRVRDLDGDGEPEVLVDLYTGGAHCCSYSAVGRFNGTTYAFRDYYWGNLSYKIIRYDGKTLMRTFDDRFAYAFAAYAYSGFPIRLVEYRAGTFRVVTRRYRSLIAADARSLWRQYRKIKSDAIGSTRGMAAAWAADRYLLGARRSALRTLRHQASIGRLKGEDSGRRFVNRLDRQLRRWGY